MTVIDADGHVTETQEQIAFLKREACDEVQGFLLGAPCPIEDYAELVGRKPVSIKSAVATH